VSSSPGRASAATTTRPIDDRRAPKRRGTVLVGVAVFVVCAIYIHSFVYRGWLPHDEGLLAHSAERFITGELPHRDFDDPYTGGLTFLHGLAFQIGGVGLTSIRTMLALWFLAFVPAVYWLAVRHAPPYLAAIVTFTCVVWSAPNYFAALPSWHVLFLSTFGTVALLRYMDTGRRGWLVAAGTCGGLAIVIKIVGLYFVAAALLFITYHEQVLSRRRHSAEDGSATRSIGFTAFTAAIGATLTGMLLLLIRRDLGMMEFLYFVTPCAALCMTMIWNDWQEGRGAFRERFLQLTASVLWLLAGVLAPILLFLIPFAVGGGLTDMLYGVFVLPTLRFLHASQPLQPLNTMLPIVFPTLVLLIGYFQTWKRSRWLTRLAYVVLATVAVVLLVFQGSWYYWNFYSLRSLLPSVVLITCVMLTRQGEHRLAARCRMELFLLAAVASMGALIQYPFASLLYFFYCAPLVLLAVHRLLSVQFAPARMVPAAFMCFFLLFGLVVNASYGVDPDGPIQAYNSLLDVDRGQLLVHENEKTQYEKVLSLVHEYSEPDAPIFATPDCPEVYFLCERPNPTRTMYDFFDDPVGRDERLLRMIDDQNISVVVINLKPAFSSKISTEFATGLWERFEAWKKVGRFVVGVGRKTPGTSASTTQTAAVPAGEQ